MAKADDLKVKEDRRLRLEAEAKKLSAAEIEARIAELQEELAILARGPFVEYPKMLPDGRVITSAEDEPVTHDAAPHDAAHKKAVK